MTHRLSSPSVDSFSGALGDLPRTRHADAEAVLAVLAVSPRFSCFDVTPTLGATLRRLEDAGRIRSRPDVGYPWIVMEVQR